MTLLRRIFWIHKLEGENPSKYRGRFLQASSTKQLIGEIPTVFYLYSCKFVGPSFPTLLSCHQDGFKHFFASKNCQQQYPTQGTRNHITPNWKFGTSWTQKCRNGMEHVGQFPRRVSFNKNHDLHFDQQKKSWEPKR